MAAETEQMLLNSGSLSQGYELLRHQLCWSAIGAVITTNYDPKALEYFLKLNDAYQISDYLPTIPDFWKKYMTDHGNENPRPPHLQTSTLPEE